MYRMAFDEKLAEKIRTIIGKDKAVTEKKMFGGLSFMYHNKMFCGVLKQDLVLKMSPKQCTNALTKPNIRPMDFTGKPLKSFVYVNSKEYKSNLKKWIKLSYNHAESVRESRS
jgi:TfoX/Sxy family transcriptional regulator of competence genes